MNKLLAPMVAAWKRFTLRWGASRWSWGGAPDYRGGYDYRMGYTTAPGNAAVQAVVAWVCRTAPEAPLVVSTRAADGTLTAQPQAPLLALLDRPNPFYSGLQLWAAMLTDLELTGDGYWIKLRGGSGSATTPGRVVELWWVPSAQMEPRWPDDGSPPFISHYEYSVQGEILRLPPADVVHFRLGFDPANLRKGLSPLRALLREIATDEEAALFTASMLHNLGVPGVVISPDAAVSATDADLEEVKLRFAERFGGTHRGEPLVLRGPTKVDVLSFSPEQMQLRELRRIPEERICALYGVPAIVVGLGAGLDRSTFANFSEAREAAYESLIIPLQRLLAADLTQQLLPDFGDPATLVLSWDYSNVRVLQDDANALMERAVRGWQGGLLTRGEARQLVGHTAAPADDVYYMPNTASLLALDAGPPEPALPASTGPDAAAALEAAAAAAAPPPERKAAPPVAITAADLAATAAWAEQVLSAEAAALVVRGAPTNGTAP